MTSSMGVPMTDDGRAAIERTLEVENVRQIDDVEAYFEIERCAKWINDNQYKRVALQCPDELLSYSARIVDKLRERCTDAVLSILADTSYASCCVDDITAEHCSADCIIHYGHACLSPCYRYPVLYVYGQEPFDADDFRFKFRQEFGREKVVVFYGVEYAYMIEQLKDNLNNPQVIYTTLAEPNQRGESKQTGELKQTGESKQTGEPNQTGESKQTGEPNQTGELKQTGESNQTVEPTYCARRVPVADGDLPSYKCLYIGTRQSTLGNLVIALNQCQFYSYDPDNKEMRKENLNVNRALMKRFNMIERTKDARIVGIIAGASGHRDYQKIVKRLKNVLRTAGKKYYTFLVGKLNVPKLANFLEIDVYVLVACQENALLEAKDFYRPVVTPFEVELACNPQREWSQAYTADFSQLLPDGSFYVPMPERVELSADVSLVTGQITTLGTSDVTEDDDVGGGAVTERNQNTGVATINSAGDFLASRTWTGLEQKLGQTPVTKAVQGQTGLARAYEDAETKEG